MPKVRLADLDDKQERVVLPSYLCSPPWCRASWLETRQLPCPQLQYPKLCPSCRHIRGSHGQPSICSLRKKQLKLLTFPNSSRSQERNGEKTWHIGTGTNYGAKWSGVFGQRLQWSLVCAVRFCCLVWVKACSLHGWGQGSAGVVGKWELGTLQERGRSTGTSIWEGHHLALQTTFKLVIYPLNTKKLGGNVSNVTWMKSSDIYVVGKKIFCNCLKRCQHRMQELRTTSSVTTTFLKKEEGYEKLGGMLSITNFVIFFDANERRRY